jgi:hypothetical protein
MYLFYSEIIHVPLVEDLAKKEKPIPFLPGISIQTLLYNSYHLEAFPIIPLVNLKDSGLVTY